MKIPILYEILKMKKKFSSFFPENSVKFLTLKAFHKNSISPLYEVWLISPLINTLEQKTSPKSLNNFIAWKGFIS